MNKKLTTLLLAFALCLLSACKSTLYITTKVLTPADINMSQHRKIAVASTTAFSGSFSQGGNIRFSGDHSADIRVAPYMYSGSVGGDMAGYLNYKLINDIQSTGYFEKVLTPPDSDMITTPGAGRSFGLTREQLVANSGIKAFINTAITAMNTDEYITSTPYYTYHTVKLKDGTTRRERELDHYSYTMHQTASITVELRIYDAETEKMIGTRTLSDSKSRSYSLPSGVYYSNSLEDYFKEMLDGMAVSIANKMIPHYTYVKQKSMDNKPKLDSVEPAYKALKNGQSDLAYELFARAWQSNRHVPSGYNAALLLQGSGDIDQAIRLMEEVYNYSKDPAAYQMLAEMAVGKRTTEEAKKQL